MYAYRCCGVVVHLHGESLTCVHEFWFLWCSLGVYVSAVAFCIKAVFLGCSLAIRNDFASIVCMLLEDIIV